VLFLGNAASVASPLPAGLHLPNVTRVRADAAFDAGRSGSPLQSKVAQQDPTAEQQSPTEQQQTLRLRAKRAFLAKRQKALCLA